MPPTYDAYAETKEKEQEKDSQLMTMQEQMALIMAYLKEKDPEKKADISREPIEITC
jgi:ribosomal protein S15P/S13E